MNIYYIFILCFNVSHNSGFASYFVRDKFLKILSHIYIYIFDILSTFPRIKIIVSKVKTFRRRVIRK